MCFIHHQHCIWIPIRRRYEILWPPFWWNMSKLHNTTLSTGSNQYNYHIAAGSANIWAHLLGAGAKCVYDGINSVHHRRKTIYWLNSHAVCRENLLKTLSIPFSLVVFLKVIEDISLYVIPSALGASETYKKSFFLFSSVVFVFLPLILLGTFNCFLVAAVRRSHKMRHKMTNTRTTVSFWLTVCHVFLLNRKIVFQCEWPNFV